MKTLTYEEANKIYKNANARFIKGLITFKQMFNIETNCLARLDKEGQKIADLNLKVLKKKQQRENDNSKSRARTAKNTSSPNIKV